MEKCAVIFDCDGTLVDSLGQALHSFNYALNKIGAPPQTLEEVKRLFGSSADRIFLKILGDKKKAFEAFEYYLDRQTEFAASTALHPGIQELLTHLKDRGIPMAVVTGRHARDLEIVLKPHHLIDFFAVLVPDSELKNSKPAPDGILQAAGELNLKAHSTIYVGDSISDIQAARAAGCGSVGALWDQHAKGDELARENPDFLAKTPMDVWDFFCARFDVS